MSIYDLLYCDEPAIREAIKADVLARYPDAKIEDASDGIHRERMSVVVNESDDVWVLFMLEIGCVDISFMTQILRISDRTKYMLLLREAVRRAQEGKAK